jgi:hypothetical protein
MPYAAHNYKQKREVEKLEFKIYWDLREDSKLEAKPEMCADRPVKEWKGGDDL